jgi:hypothetical protein
MRSALAESSKCCLLNLYQVSLCEGSMGNGCNGVRGRPRKPTFEGVFRVDLLRGTGTSL